jgi:hypothetical protein
LENPITNPQLAFGASVPAIIAGRELSSILVSTASGIVGAASGVGAALTRGRLLGDILR